MRCPVRSRTRCAKSCRSCTELTDFAMNFLPHRSPPRSPSCPTTGQEVQASVVKLARITPETNGLSFTANAAPNTEEGTLMRPSRYQLDEVQRSAEGDSVERLVFYEYCISLIFFSL